MFLPYKIEDERHFAGKAILVYSFCAIYLLGHIVLYNFLPESYREDIFYRFGCVPIDFKWWTPLTCTFLHGNWLHIIGNLYFFWIYGRNCEKYLGSVRFLILYLLGAFVSVGTHVITVPAYYNDIPTIGASGAISAVLGAFLIFFPTVKIRMLIFSVIYSRPLPSHAPAYFVLGSWFIVQIAYGLQIVSDVMGVAFWAHIAGFATGAAVASIYKVLSHISEEKHHEQEEKQLMPIWESFLNGAPIPQQLIQSVKSHSDNNICAEELFIYGLFNNNPEQAKDFLLKAFLKNREENNYAGVLQCFRALTDRSDISDLPVWVYREGAIAAARTKHYHLALYGFSRVLSSNESIERMDQLLLGISTVLEKLNLNEKSEEIKKLITEFFPDSAYSGKNI
jgi:membrane associated rhomboid family serine protease